MRFCKWLKKICVISAVGVVFAGGMAEARMSDGMEQVSLGLSGVENARDIGGYATMDGRHVRKGLLLRSGKLDKATKSDKGKLLQVYQLKEIIDFRTSTERSQAMDPQLPGVKNVWLKILNEDVQSHSNTMIANMFQPPAKGTPEADNPAYGMVQAIKAGVYSTQMYVPIVTSEYSRHQYRAFFQELLKPREGALLWHCTGGKDRTGIAAVLTLSALGVDRETIIRDYLLTNDFDASTIQYMLTEANKLTRDPHVLIIVPKLTGVDREIIESFYTAVEKEYGTMDNFLKKGIGLTDRDIQALQRRYLE